MKHSFQNILYNSFFFNQVRRLVLCRITTNWESLREHDLLSFKCVFAQFETLSSTEIPFICIVPLYNTFDCSCSLAPDSADSDGYHHPSTPAYRAPPDQSILPLFSSPLSSAFLSVNLSSTWCCQWHHSDCLALPFTAFLVSTDTRCNTTDSTQTRNKKFP